jgi:hypothetical protein
MCGRPVIRTAVWSFDNVLGALADVLRGSGDLQQVRGFVDACEALNVKPLTADELTAHAEDRRGDLVRVLDWATASLFGSGDRAFPSGSDADFVVALPRSHPRRHEHCGRASRRWHRMQ